MSESAAFDPIIQKGNIVCYRLFDVGEEIDLAAAERLLRQPGERFEFRLAPGKRRALQVRNPPLRVNLGDVTLNFGSDEVRAEVAATVWDYAVLSMVFRIPIPPGTRWSQLIARAPLYGAESKGATALDSSARAMAHELFEALKKAVKAPFVSTIFEDYTLYFLEDIGGAEVCSRLAGDRILAELALGEPRIGDALSAVTMKPVLENVYQYKQGDLVLIDWDTAVVVEPSGERDISDVIEFALTHLLEFRFYDDLLDQKIASLYDSIDAKRGWVPGAYYSSISREANYRYIEITEFIERVENSLKVVGDFYIAYIYRGAIKRFRISDWGASITRKLNLMARVSELLQGEVNVYRSHALELIVILLICFEIISALVRNR
ncbi:MAG: hypothetical protein P4M08_03810 [Oligoflexia bacterium]|nr:hypothetical protein [Oligoflexia bacterium]